MQASIKEGANINSKSIKFIEIKGLIFNKVIWAKLDEFLNYISKKTKFGIHNDELWYIKWIFWNDFCKRKKKTKQKEREKQRISNKVRKMNTKKFHLKTLKSL